MPQPGSAIVVDGSFGEGGGALLRTAMAMATVTQQPLRVVGIRGATRHPGLDAEDLTLLTALSAISGAETAGAEIGSSSIEFKPTRKPRGLNGTLTTFRNEDSRGPNAPVVLCSLLPVLAKTGMYSSVSSTGETHGLHSLSFDYFANVTLHANRAFGLYAYPRLEEAGFGRDSAGTVSLDVEPSGLQGINWTERGKLHGLQAVVTTAGLSPALADRAISHLRRLAQSANVPLEVESKIANGKSPGVFVTVWAIYDSAVGGGASMGQRGLRIEAVTQNAFNQVFDWMASDATVDPFLADQILLTAVLADTQTEFKVSRLTQRFLTAAWVVKQFIPIHITIRGAEDAPGVVTIRK